MTEPSRPRCSYVGRETNTQQIYVIDNTLCVFQPQNIAGLGAPSEQSGYRRVHALVAEIPQKGVPRPQGQKTKGATFYRRRTICTGKNSIYDFVRGAISTNSNEVPITSGVGFAGNRDSLSGRGRFSHVDLNSGGSQPVEGRRDQLSAASPSRSRIYHCEKLVIHNPTTAERCRRLRTSSASSVRLIFMDAVRGKSLSQIT